MQADRVIVKDALDAARDALGSDLSACRAASGADPGERAPHPTRVRGGGVVGGRRRRPCALARASGAAAASGTAAP